MYKLTKNNLTKAFSTLVISVILVALFGFSLSYPQKTSAQAECVGVQAAFSLKNKAESAVKVATANNDSAANETANVKECVLDTVAIVLRETLIRKITSSIVTWINSGFEGSPAFVTDLDDFLLDTADEAFGTYIYNDTNFAHLCSPFEFDIRFSLALSYSTDAARPTCTLSNIVDNVETAIDDLSVDWDWDVYETITTDPSGNIFSSYIQSQENITNFITGTVNQDQEEINRNQGFLSFRKCTTSEDANTYGARGSNLADATQEEIEEAGRKNTQSQDCKVVTPGSVIQDTLSSQLNLDTERLALADEFNEIIGALMGQLVQKAFTGSGVAGLTERSGGSNSFLSDFSSDLSEANRGVATTLTNQTINSTETYEEYIGIQNESIQSLLQAKIKVSETFACYTSKYNTFINENGEVLDPSEVDTTDLENLTRATFTDIDGYNPRDILQGIIPSFLTPSQSLAKAQEYQNLLVRIDNDLVTAESEIEQAREAIAITERYQSGLETSRTAQSSSVLYQEYSNAIAGVQIDPDTAQVGLQNINSYTDIAVNGELTYNIDGAVREGGAINDLATCQTFNQVVAPQGETI